MRHTIRSAMLLGVLILIAGCSNLSQLSSRDPQEKGDFRSQLAAEYLAYAQSEAEQGQKQDAEYYAEKGLRASRGEVVAPESLPDTLRTKSKSYQALSTARTRLMKLLTEQAKAASPQLAARTQLLFDCWIDQQLETEAEEIISCSQEFKLSARDLERKAR